MVVCVLPPSPSPTGRMATPSLHSCEESSPILVSHCSVTWTKEMPVSCPSGIHPGQGLLPSHNITNSFLPPTFCFPFRAFLPLSFLGEHLSKTGLMFALISSLKRLLMPRSHAFSPFPHFPIQWAGQKHVLTVCCPELSSVFSLLFLSSNKYVLLFLPEVWGPAHRPPPYFFCPSFCWSQLTAGEDLIVSCACFAGLRCAVFLWAKLSE